MDKEQHSATRRQMIALMQAGQTWQEAARKADLQISRSTAYRLWQKVRIQGDAGVQDGRHGHPYKVSEPVRQWLKDTDQADPHTPSHVVQQALKERFGLDISVSHLNAVRTALGRESHRKRSAREKNGRCSKPVRHSGKKEQGDCCW